MLPNLTIPSLDLGPLTFHPFGLLVGIGIFLGISFITRRGLEYGLEEKHLNSMAWWGTPAMGMPLVRSVRVSPSTLEASTASSSKSS